MAATDGSRAPWQFTTSPQSSNSPRWSPDGKWLAFLSSRPGSDLTTPAPTASPAPAAGPTPAAAAGATSSDQPRNQVYLLAMNGGEAKRITNLKNGVSVFRWSPDGSRLVVVSRTGPSDNRSESRDRSDVRHYQRISLKSKDNTWVDEPRTHLWNQLVPEKM